MDPPVQQIGEVAWEIPRDAAPGMRVPGRFFASNRMLERMRSDNALRQIVNVAHLPGIVGHSLGMPDLHWGYGFPIGGVAATDPAQGGVISPGGVGYDICCGVRLIATALAAKDLARHIEALGRALVRDVPCGLGEDAARSVSRDTLVHVLEDGVAGAAEEGLVEGGCLDRIEERGRLPNADPGALSERALQRGERQLGSLGAGNHFVEVQVVDSIFDGAAARAMGLEEGAATVMVHTGSRGLGYQVCDDSLRLLRDTPGKYGFKLPDRQLVCAPVRSAEGERYLAAMGCAANYAFANRQMIAEQAQTAFARALGVSPGALGFRLVYDVPHNIAKMENHRVGGRPRTLCVHRKGATRAFPPGHPDVPAAYRAIGQPVIVPGDMGRYSFVLAGSAGAEWETFGSVCHGAGRRMSRSEAKRKGDYGRLMDEMRSRGVLLLARGKKTALEEAPAAYKDVAQVVDVVERAGLARTVARLRPMAVIKG